MVDHHPDFEQAFRPGFTKFIDYLVRSSRVHGPFSSWPAGDCLSSNRVGMVKGSAALERSCLKKIATQ